MKSTIKKAFAILLAMIMVIGIVPITVSASDSTPEPPANIWVADVTDTTITVALEVSPSESVVKYEITNWDTVEVYGETTETTYTIEGLNPNTPYSIAVCGVTEAGVKSSFLITMGTTLGRVTLYFKPNENWLQDNARFAAYVFHSITNESRWIDLTELESDTGYYRADITDKYNSILFCRMNPASLENDWSYVWNQSIDLTIPTDGNNCFTYSEGSWTGGTGTWSYFEPTVAIETQDMASVRLSESYPGLRFKTKIHKAYLEQLIEAYGAENVSVGTLITPTDILGDKDFTHELGVSGVDYIDVVAKVDTPFGSDSDYNDYAGSIVKIKKANLDRDFSAVGYIKIVEGNNVRYEYSESIAVRNVSEIADAALEDTNDEYVTGYENKVSEGVYSPYTAAQREILESLVAPPVIDTYEELQEAVNAGGTVTLGGDINFGDINKLDIYSKTVTINFNGYKFIGSPAYIIYIADGDLTVINANFETSQYPIHIESGKLKVVDSYSHTNAFEAMTIGGENALIDLSEYTGESIKLTCSENNFSLDDIILPEGWKLYDTSDNEVATTTKWETIVAKPAISE